MLVYQINKMPKNPQDENGSERSSSKSSKSSGGRSASASGKKKAVTISTASPLILRPGSSSVRSSGDDLAAAPSSEIVATSAKSILKKTNSNSISADDGQKFEHLMPANDEETAVGQFATPGNPSSFLDETPGSLVYKDRQTHSVPGAENNAAKPSSQRNSGGIDHQDTISKEIVSGNGNGNTSPDATLKRGSEGHQPVVTALNKKAETREDQAQFQKTLRSVSPPVERSASSVASRSPPHSGTESPGKDPASPDKNFKTDSANSLVAYPRPDVKDKSQDKESLLMAELFGDDRSVKSTKSDAIGDKKLAGDALSFRSEGHGIDRQGRAAFMKPPANASLYQNQTPQASIEAQEEIPQSKGDANNSFINAVRVGMKDEPSPPESNLFSNSDEARSVRSTRSDGLFSGRKEGNEDVHSFRSERQASQLTKGFDLDDVRKELLGNPVREISSDESPASHLASTVKSASGSSKDGHAEASLSPAQYAETSQMKVFLKQSDGEDHSIRSTKSEDAERRQQLLASNDNLSFRSDGHHKTDPQQDLAISSFLKEHSTSQQLDTKTERFTPDSATSPLLHVSSPPQAETIGIVHHDKNHDESNRKLLLLKHAEEEGSLKSTRSEMLHKIGGHRIAEDAVSYRSEGHADDGMLVESAKQPFLKSSGVLASQHLQADSSLVLTNSLVHIETPVENDRHNTETLSAGSSENSSVNIPSFDKRIGNMAGENEISASPIIADRNSDRNFTVQSQRSTTLGEDTSLARSSRANSSDGSVSFDDESSKAVNERSVASDEPRKRTAHRELDQNSYQHPITDHQHASSLPTIRSQNLLSVPSEVLGIATSTTSTEHHLTATPEEEAIYKAHYPSETTHHHHPQVADREDGAKAFKHLDVAEGHHHNHPELVTMQSIVEEGETSPPKQSFADDLYHLQVESDKRHGLFFDKPSISIEITDTDAQENDENEQLLESEHSGEIKDNDENSEEVGADDGMDSELAEVIWFDIYHDARQEFAESEIERFDNDAEPELQQDLEKKIIAIIGATGNQGGSLLRAIINEGPNSEFVARAIVHDAFSEKTQRLRDIFEDLQIIEADLNDERSIIDAVEDCYGMFCVTPLNLEHPEQEAVQAENMAFAARETGIKHVIWSTLEDTRKYIPLESDVLPTIDGKYKVPHLDIKGESDQFFEDLPTTYLLTSCFWENWLGGPKKGRDGKLYATLPMGKKRLPGMAVEDVGKCALAIFKRPEQYINKRIGIVGESLSVSEIADRMTVILGRSIRGKAVPFDAYRNMTFPGAMEIGNMFQFIHDCDAFRNNRSVDETRKLNPGVLSFEKWLIRNKARIPIPK